MANLDPVVGAARLALARVGHLATVTEADEPHVVPCCFVRDGERIYSAVDGKPKSTSALKRLDNVRARPAASLLVDHYDDDWAQLWWVRADGAARVVESEEERAVAIDELAKKYEQYRIDRPQGAVLCIDVTRITGWSFTPPSGS